MGKDAGGNRKKGRTGGAGASTPQGTNWSNPAYNKAGVNATAAAEVHNVSLTPVGQNLGVGAPIAPMRIIKSDLDVTNKFRLVNAYMPTEVFATARTAERLQGFAADMLLTVTQG